MEKTYIPALRFDRLTAFYDPLIRWTLREATFKTEGRKVATLEASAEKEAGYHAVVWDGRSDAGAPVASGVYFARMRAGRFMQTRQMVLAK